MPSVIPLDQRAFIEELSLRLDEEGFPRMAGRILAWLLICEPEHQSAAEIGEALEASKGSVSTMTRLLMNIRLVEKVGAPGRRETLFRMKPGVWTNLLDEHPRKAGVMRRLAEDGLKLLARESESRRERLMELRDLYAFIEREFPALIARWEAERSVRNSREDAAD